MRSRILILSLSVTFLFSACASSTPTDPAVEDGPALLTVTPAGGTVDVGTNQTVKITFSHPMATGMEDLADLHEGGVDGPKVGGVWRFSTDRMVLSFQPEVALKSSTTYTIHMGGGMMGHGGNPLNYNQHGMHMGGQWANGSMMNGGMGGHMGGHNGQQGHMGSGWQHANGTFGMVFSFTTG